MGGGAGWLGGRTPRGCAVWRRPVGMAAPWRGGRPRARAAAATVAAATGVRRGPSPSTPALAGTDHRGGTGGACGAARPPPPREGVAGVAPARVATRVHGGRPLPPPRRPAYAGAPLPARTRFRDGPPRGVSGGCVAVTAARPVGGAAGMAPARVPAHPRGCARGSVRRALWLVPSESIPPVPLAAPVQWGGPSQRRRRPTGKMQTRLSRRRPPPLRERNPTMGRRP